MLTEDDKTTTPTGQEPAPGDNATAPPTRHEQVPDDAEVMEELFGDLSEEPPASEGDADGDNGDPGNATPAPGSGLPEKFTGKTAEEIAHSYTNLESFAGKTKQELATLKKTIAGKLGVDPKDLDLSDLDKLSMIEKGEEQAAANAASDPADPPKAGDGDGEGEPPAAAPSSDELYSKFTADPQKFMKEWKDKITTDMVADLKAQVLTDLQKEVEEKSQNVDLKDISLNFVQSKLDAGIKVNQKELAEIIAANPELAASGDPQKALELGFELWQSRQKSTKGTVPTGGGQTPGSTPDDVEEALGLDDYAGY